MKPRDTTQNKIIYIKVIMVSVCVGSAWKIIPVTARSMWSWSVVDGEKGSSEGASTSEKGTNEAGSSGGHKRKKIGQGGYGRGRTGRGGPARARKDRAGGTAQVKRDTSEERSGRGSSTDALCTRFTLVKYKGMIKSVTQHSYFEKKPNK